MSSEKKKPSLTIKEKLFCFYYVKLQNSEEAAKKASLGNRVNCEQLLHTQRVQQYLKSLTECTAPADSEAALGYRRLAFGKVNDAVKLVMSQVNGEWVDPEPLDLFSVSEIKIAKGGGMEIKFFDRQKALDQLYEMSSQNREDLSEHSLYDALEQSAKQLQAHAETAE